ncbi:MAG: TerD family protein [Rhodospirillaceae bacterium]|nr:TerD family protein [Rhodospirillaceae bacterium]
MVLGLFRGGNVSLKDKIKNMKRVLIGMGWDPLPGGRGKFDLDVSVFLVNRKGKVAYDEDFIFYNNLKSADGAVEHLGDNRTGQGEGDDEQVTLDLEMLSPDIDKIVFAVSIHDAERRDQNFGMVSNAYIRVVDGAANDELVRFDLTEGVARETAMIFGELYRNKDHWKFKAVGQGYAEGLKRLAADYGVEVE